MLKARLIVANNAHRPLRCVHVDVSRVQGEGQEGALHRLELFLLFLQTDISDLFAQILEERLLLFYHLLHSVRHTLGLEQIGFSLFKFFFNYILLLNKLLVAHHRGHPILSHLFFSHKEGV